jgi:pectin methylesterase-like acyl-CoA thioesterase
MFLTAPTGPAPGCARETGYLAQPGTSLTALFGYDILDSRLERAGQNPRAALATLHNGRAMESVPHT